SLRTPSRRLMLDSATARSLPGLDLDNPLESTRWLSLSSHPIYTTSGDATDPEQLAGCRYCKHVLLPVLFVKVNRQQPAGLISQQRIDANCAIPRKVASDHLRSERQVVVGIVLSPTSPSRSRTESRGITAPSIPTFPMHRIDV